MKPVACAWQVVFVMEDGAELAWKIFSTFGKYQAFADGVSEEHMSKLGIRKVSYRVRFIE